MATALYGTMLVAPGNVEAVKRYLYAATEIVATSMVSHAHCDLAFLILRTEEETERLASAAQQYQCDRFASGMHGMTIGFETRYAAERHVYARANDNDWGVVGWHPGSALVSA